MSIQQHTETITPAWLRENIGVDLTDENVFAKEEFSMDDDEFIYYCLVGLNYPLNGRFTSDILKRICETWTQQRVAAMGMRQCRNPR